MKTNKRPLLTIALAFLFSISCSDEATEPTTFYGPEQQLGGGTIKSVVTLDAAGNPESVGITFPESTFTGLPHAAGQYVLELPAQASATAFKHILFDWNPHGHQPDGLYGLPHFDMHFYTISSQERTQINHEDPQTEEELAALSSYMPQNYIPTMDVVPMMGMHWINPASPEFNGEAFSKTFIMGSYNEKVIFYEPMITLAHLQEKKTEQMNLLLPEAYQQTGVYYPTKYNIAYDAGSKAYTVSLTGMVKR